MAKDSTYSKSEKKVDKLKDNINEYFNFFDNNIKRYKKSIRFAFKETLSDSDRRKLRKIKKPEIEINYIQAYLSRLLGEFSKQTPEVKVRGTQSYDDVSAIDANTVEVVEGIIRQIFSEYEKTGEKNQVLKEQCGGGYSVLKIDLDYKNSTSFDKVIKLKKANVPVLCFFDPKAKRSSKSDGKYAGEIFPMTSDEFKIKFPDHASKLDNMKNKNSSLGTNLNWSYRNMSKDIVLVADYYCVEYDEKTILLLADGNSILEDDYDDYNKRNANFGPKIEIKKKRKSNIKYIKRYVLFGEDIIKDERTDYPGLPYIFVDGDSSFVYKNDSGNQIEQVIRSYIYNAIDAQKTLNYMCQTIANFAENLMQQKHIIDERAIVDAESWTNPQTASVLIKKSIDDKGVPIPNPVENVHQEDLPTSIMSTFSSMQNVMQNTLGAYDAMLGINEKELSGIAIQEGATLNNAIAMPFINGYLDAMNSCGDFIIKTLPKAYVTPMTIPIIDSDQQRSFIKINQISGDGSPYGLHLDYSEDELEIDVSSGYNFTIQKDKALKTVIALSDTVPAFGELMNQKGLKFILENLEIRGIEQLIELAKQQEQMITQKSAQPTPEQQQMMIKNKELALKQQKMQMDAQSEMDKLEMKRKQLAVDTELAVLRLEKEAMNDRTQNAKVEAEIRNSQIKAATDFGNHILAHENQQHQHTIDVMRLGSAKNV